MVTGIKKEWKREEGCFVFLQILSLALVLWAMIHLDWRRADRIQMIPALITLIFKICWRDRERERLMGAAILMIAISDFFLCFLYGCGFEAGETLGYIGFCICQFLFALSMGMDRKNRIFRVVLALLLESGVYLIGMMSFGNFWGALNLSLLLGNVIISWIRCRQDPRDLSKRLRAIGLTCFAGCDYGLLVYALLPSWESCRPYVGLWVWICYVPAQVFLLLSWRRYKAVE